MSTNEPSTNEPPIDLFLAASTNQALATESKANQNQTNGEGSDSDDSMAIDEPDETTDQSLKVIPPFLLLTQDILYHTRLWRQSASENSWKESGYSVYGSPFHRWR
jgi:hypothetical protein